MNEVICYMIVGPWTFPPHQHPTEGFTLEVHNKCALNEVDMGAEF